MLLIRIHCARSIRLTIPGLVCSCGLVPRLFSLGMSITICILARPIWSLKFQSGMVNIGRTWWTYQFAPDVTLPMIMRSRTVQKTVLLIIRWSSWQWVSCAWRLKTPFEKGMVCRYSGYGNFCHSYSKQASVTKQEALSWYSTMHSFGQGLSIQVGKEGERRWPLETKVQTLPLKY